MTFMPVVESFDDGAQAPSPNEKVNAARSAPFIESPNLRLLVESVFLADGGVARLCTLQGRPRREAFGVRVQDRASLEHFEREHVSNGAAEDDVGHREVAAEDEVTLVDGALDGFDHLLVCTPANLTRFERPCSALRHC